MKKFLFIILLLSSSEFLWAQNMIIYVAPQLVKCGGNIDVMCLQIREESEKTYEHLVTNIEGFMYEEGNEYKLSVYRGYHENPPSIAPAVYYTLKKIISKKLPNDTLEIANRMTTCEDTKMFQCLMYKKKGESEWHNLSGKIKGFKYTAGYDYELVVSKKAIDNMGAVGTYEYTLVKTLSKKPTMIISEKNRKALNGKKFVLTGYCNEDKFEQAATYPKQVFIVFNLDENSMSGSDGCNQMSGRVEINNSKISFGPIMATKMYCVDVIIDKIFQANLHKVNKYKISGSKLQLFEDKLLILELEQ